mgnify:CR=1 FL=1
MVVFSPSWILSSPATEYTSIIKNFIHTKKDKKLRWPGSFWKGKKAFCFHPNKSGDLIFWAVFRDKGWYLDPLANSVWPRLGYGVGLRSSGVGIEGLVIPSLIIALKAIWASQNYIDKVLRWQNHRWYNLPSGLLGSTSMEFLLLLDGGPAGPGPGGPESLGGRSHRGSVINKRQNTFKNPYGKEDETCWGDLQ